MAIVTRRLRSWRRGANNARTSAHQTPPAECSGRDASGDPLELGAVARKRGYVPDRMPVRGDMRRPEHIPNVMDLAQSATVAASSVSTAIFVT